MIVPSHISTKIYKVFQSTMHFKFGWFWITGNQKSLLWSAQSSMSSDTPATVTFWCWTRFHLIHSLYFHTKYPVLQPLIFIYFLSLLFQHFSYCFLNLYHVPLDILQLIYSFEGTRKKKSRSLSHFSSFIASNLFILCCLKKYISISAGRQFVAL